MYSCLEKGINWTKQEKRPHTINTPSPPHHNLVEVDQEWVVAGKHPLNVHNGMGSPHVDAGRQQGGDTVPSMEGEFLELGEVNNAVVVLVENGEQALDVIRLRREFQRLQPRLNLRRRGTQGSDEQGRIRFIICDLRVLVERSRSGYCSARSSTTRAGVTRHSNRNKVRRTNCNAQRAIAPINQQYTLAAG